MIACKTSYALFNCASAWAGPGLEGRERKRHALLQSQRMNALREKVIVAAIVTASILIFYFGSLYSTVFDPVLIPNTRVDRAIPFLPIFVIPYFSYYFFLLSPLFIIRDLESFRETAFGMGTIVLISCVVFFFWPTAITTSYTDPLLRALLAVDRPRNACPSLHASLTLFCALMMHRHIRRKAGRSALWGWAALIIASTLFTKRHAVIDIAVGMAFGWSVYQWIIAPRLPSTSAINGVADAECEGIPEV
jgi:membrane-associated phospholipid phosphatase